MSGSRPHWLNWAFAHPMYISWIMGTIGLWIAITLLFWDSGVFQSLTTDWSMILLVLISYAATSGLGFFLGGIGISWLVFAIARRVNGAPHEIGESVMILSGPYSGRVTTIYEIPRGQGGQSVLKVDLGAEAKQKYQDIFEEYALLRMSSQHKIEI